jgi:hypothetical protein
MCFGATFLLDSTFPTYIPLSKVLDLTDDMDRRIATAYVRKSLEHCRRFDELTPSCIPKSVDQIGLNSEFYYSKILTPAVIDRGLGLFGELRVGLDHMIRCLNRLYANAECRHVAEYPLSVRTPDSQDSSHTAGRRMPDSCYFQLIYRDLTRLGFRMGTPNRIIQPLLYDEFVLELKRMVRLVHAAGVVHSDLYASNIMWQEKDQRVELKIIDWDVAHCLDERCFSPQVESILRDRLQYSKIKGNEVVPLSEEHDLTYVRVYEMEVTEANTRLWQELASGSKSQVDAAFQNLMTEMLNRG